MTTDEKERLFFSVLRARMVRPTHSQQRSRAALKEVLREVGIKGLNFDYPYEELLAMVNTDWERLVARLLTKKGIER